MVARNDELTRFFKGIRECVKCERCRTRYLAVPGAGNPYAALVLIGEAPGRKEDAEGRPFVGRTGVYLDGVLAENNVSRDDFFITSILKCYHPGQPKLHQVQACKPWSDSQIQAIAPRLILVMGLTAASGLLGMRELGNAEIDSEWQGVRCVVTCHPAAAMRFPGRNRQFRRDFERVLKLL